MTAFKIGDKVRIVEREARVDFVGMHGRLTLDDGAYGKRTILMPDSVKLVSRTVNVGDVRKAGDLDDLVDGTVIQGNVSRAHFVRNGREWHGPHDVNHGSYTVRHVPDAA